MRTIMKTTDTKNALPGKRAHETVWENGYFENVNDKTKGQHFNYIVLLVFRSFQMTATGSAHKTNHLNKGQLRSLNYDKNQTVFDDEWIQFSKLINRIRPIILNYNNNNNIGMNGGSSSSSSSSSTESSTRSARTAQDPKKIIKELHTIINLCRNVVAIFLFGFVFVFCRHFILG